MLSCVLRVVNIGATALVTEATIAIFGEAGVSAATTVMTVFPGPIYNYFAQISRTCRLSCIANHVVCKTNFLKIFMYVKF